MGIGRRLCASDRRLVIRTNERLLLRSPSARVRPIAVCRVESGQSKPHDLMRRRPAYGSAVMYNSSSPKSTSVTRSSLVHPWSNRSLAVPVNSL